MSNRFSLLLKKESGFERMNEEVIRTLETDGWRADRHLVDGFVAIRTARNYHIYKNELELKHYLLTLLKKEEVSRVVLVKE